MGWFFWLLVIHFGGRAVYTMIYVGDRRAPISRSDALMAVVTGTLWIAGLFHYWGR